MDLQKFEIDRRKEKSKLGAHFGTKYYERTVPFACIDPCF